MSGKATYVVIGMVVLGLGILLSVIPGSPIWRIFHPAKTVTLAGPHAADAPERTLRIISVLPKDAIPAILNPTFLSGEQADQQMRPSETVIGLSINGDHRAYSTSHLNNHEAVNDTVGGVPVLVTW